MAELSYTLLRLLPKNTLSRAVGAACRASAPRPVVRAVIRAFARKYGVDMSEAERPIDEYPTFTEFSGRRPQRGEALLRQRAPDHFPEDDPRRVRCGGDRRDQRRADPRRIRRRRHQCAAHPPAGAQDLRAPAAHGEGRRAGSVRDGLDGGRALRAGSEARAAPAARAAGQARRSAGIAMSQKIRGVKGTRDVLPIDTYVKDDDPCVRVGHYQLIEQTARELF